MVRAPNDPGDSDAPMTAMLAGLISLVSSLRPNSSVRFSI